MPSDAADAADDLILHINQADAPDQVPTTAVVGRATLPTTIGRSVDCAVTIDQSGVSRRHCAIEAAPEGGGLLVRDLESKSGTYVGSARVETTAPLSDGDIVRIGGVVIRVELGEWSGDRVDCEMCGAVVTDGGRPLADERAICGACDGQLEGLTAVGPYRRLRQLGDGVYKAVHLEENRLVAIRTVVWPSWVLDGQIAQTMHEVHRSRKMGHPRIVGVQQVLTDARTAHIVMDYVDGTDLQGLVDGHGPLSPLRAAQLAHELAEAIDYLHAAKLVHDGVKPRNVIVQRIDGHALLCSMGQDTVKALGRGTDVIGAEPALFVAPELFEDASAGGVVTDVYGLAATVYFALAGRPPYQAQTLRQLRDAMRAGEPELVTAHRPQLPERVALVLAAGLRRERDRRPGSARELAAGVVEALEG